MPACCHLRRRQREKNRRAGSGSERPERLDVLEFGGIEPNPSYETLMNAVKIAREEKITFLLAGRRLRLDGTKFIAAAAHYDASIDPWEILETYGSKVASAIPMGSVLTLPATGSESNKGAVIA
jgi:NADP-dependent alcohol dehydrogenase